MKGNMNKKVLCITDRDLKINTKEDLIKIKNFIPTHIIKLLHRKETKLENKRITLNKNIPECRKYTLKKESKKIYYVKDNIVMVCQDTYGSTFEDELFISNFENTDVAKKLLKVALSESLHPYIDANQLNFDLWDVNREQIDGRSRSKITNLIDSFKNIIAAEQEDEKKDRIKKLFFGKLFLEYAKDCKGLQR